MIKKTLWPGLILMTGISDDPTIMQACEDMGEGLTPTELAVKVQSCAVERVTNQ